MKLCRLGCLNRAMESLARSEDIFNHIRGGERSPAVREHTAVCVGKIMLMHDMGMIDWEQKTLLVEELEEMLKRAID